MERGCTQLGAYLAEAGLDGYLIDDSAANPDQRYLSGFDAIDPFLCLVTGGEINLLVRDLDRRLAERESHATNVTTPASFDRATLVDTYGPDEADERVRVRFLRAYNVESVAVPSRFPIGVAEALRRHGIAVEPDREAIIEDIRAVKTSTEIAYIQQAQRATERAMARAEDLLRAASIDGGDLIFEGNRLTSERVKAEIEMCLLRHGCILEETIVAGGEEASNPHERGSGSLAAHEPIVIDIFPKHRDSKYHADMTRTFCVGEPDSRARDWYALTREAQIAAIDRIAPGVSGSDVHAAACEVYESEGIPTTRSHEGTTAGYIHGTGHGIGLAVHESPRLNPTGGTLQPGHVVTVEPGLYDPAIGGIRLEDIVHVTEDGCVNLTDFEKSFVVS